MSATDDDKKARVHASFAKILAGMESYPEPVELPSRPELPAGGDLSRADQWTSLRWAIDVAEQHGRNGLDGLALALARLIQAEAISNTLLDARDRAGITGMDDLLWDPDEPFNDAGTTLDTLPQLSEQVEVRVGECVAIPSPRLAKKLVPLLAKIGPDRQFGEWRQQRRDQQDYVMWQPWPILWVAGGGHHSTTVAVIAHPAAVVRPHVVIDASSLLRDVQCDGEYWTRTDNGKVLERVESLPMAGLFEIGKRLRAHKT
jgi:hypothetical protein